MGRSTIERQINNILYGKQGFGESRHEAKQQLREEKGTEYRFGMTDDKMILSILLYTFFSRMFDLCSLS